MSTFRPFKPIPYFIFCCSPSPVRLEVLVFSFAYCKSRPQTRTRYDGLLPRPSAIPANFTFRGSCFKFYNTDTGKAKPLGSSTVKQKLACNRILRILEAEIMPWLQYISGFRIFTCKLQDKINQKKTRTAYFQLFHSYISMQRVNGFSPPSKRHPVAPTTLKEQGEVPIPLPVLCSLGGGSGRRQLYTKMTDHRFCCLPACLLVCLPGFFCVLRRTQTFLWFKSGM
jgi:hypothetical protein